MLTKQPTTILPLFGYGLAVSGVLWENLLGPSLIGWGVMISGLILQFKTVEVGAKRTVLDPPLLLMLLVGGVSAWATANLAVTSLQLTRLGSALVAYYATVFWARTGYRVLMVYIGLIAGGAVLAATAPVIVDWNVAKGIPLPEKIYAAFPQLVSDTVHPNIMATLMVLLLPFPASHLLSSRQNADGRSTLNRLLALVACGLMGTVLILTKSRGGYLAGAVGATIVLWCSRRRKLAFFLAMTVAIVGIWLGLTAEQQAPEIIGGVADSSTWAFRQEVWRIALWMVGDFPFTGVGMGTFNEVASRLYPFPIVDNLGAHNLFLQVAVDLGLIGLIAFLAVSILVCGLAKAAIRHSDISGDEAVHSLTVGAFAAVLAYYVHGLVDVAAWGTRAGFIPWLVFSFTTSLYSYARKQSERYVADRAV